MEKRSKILLIILIIVGEMELYLIVYSGGLLPPLNHNKITVTNNYIFIVYRRGELCSPVFNLL